MKKLSINSLLTLLLLCTAVFALILFNYAKHYYHDLNRLKLDPLELHKVDISNPPSDLAVVYYGDSRALQWTEPTWLKGRTLNIGIGSQTTEQVLARFDHHLAPLKPNIVIVQAGVNDLKTIPLFPQDEANIIARCKSNLKLIVEQAQAQGAHVIVTTIFPLGKVPLQRKIFWSKQVDEAIINVNQYIHSLSSNNVTVFVSKDVLANKSGLVKSQLSHDLLHLNEQGYKALNNAMRRTVESILQQNAGNDVL